MNGGNSAPKWGTPEWLVAFPLSKMDRKRRKRAVHAVGDAAKLVTISKLDDWYSWFVTFATAPKSALPEMTKREYDRFNRAVETVRQVDTAVRDSAFAFMLETAWKRSGVWKGGR